ncbi:MAG: pyrophosphate--fructose-6-phosphate 1-phosphotransferase [Candidatus Marinimicrobia bacterium]|jgi:pyrophosphate--fructose-6-phosphate 1-phosphotransferase|nr:pyrophosphate--fructose-6-phosphate 1-phosphotransferase [Candidatus Neomarinimicrobiota bacterium]MDP6499774.1 pyrophosphate--fructose-6-phosphate 1-phosphotransferase [Candidatus Neomarinimicrobiota bacterium]|tara:strand:+ start:8341 stop:9534 length:1194 start_codon:yes stop_codon:yes gene_type:complete
MKIAFLTAGGLAPCLSASIGALIKQYHIKEPDADLIGYLNGYRGLLLGKTIQFPDNAHSHADILMKYGGSPIGNSRVKLTNMENCIKNGYIKDGENPVEVAANQLKSDGVDILHTIGGDDTNTMAAELANYLSENNYGLTVVGLPKTVDNDVFPIARSLGADTAAEQGAIFFENIANENTTSTRQLIIHEVMGRHCGWLTAATAKKYRERLDGKSFVDSMLISRKCWDVDAIYIPEEELNFEAECERLNKRMAEKDGVNIFLSEGAGIDTIVNEMEAEGENVPRDAFGHVRLDEINPGQWFAEKFKEKLNAEKVLVQKSGYFARSAAPNKYDVELITRSAALAAEQTLAGASGVAGLDEDKNNEMSLIEFSRIKGGKPFDTSKEWYQQLLTEIENQI